MLFRRYMASFDTARPASTLFRLLGESVLLATLLYYSYAAVLGGDKNAVESTDSGYEMLAKHPFLQGVLLMPIIETILCQFLPWEITRRFTKSFWPPFMVSWVLFAGLHFTNSFASGMSAGLVGGFYFILAYSFFRPKSVWHAIGATYILHAAYNFVVIGITQ
jgi:hypothetical protein